MERVVVDPKAAEELRSNIRGAVLVPTDEGYDAARRIWNGMIDRRPAVIANSTGSADVCAAVRFARQHRLAIAVRGGGHNVAGNAICDDGLVIDLSPLRIVRADPERKVLRVAGGAVLGDIDHEAQAFGMPSRSGLTTGDGERSRHRTTRKMSSAIPSGFRSRARVQPLAMRSLAQAQPRFRQRRRRRAAFGSAHAGFAYRMRSARQSREQAR